MKCTRCGFEMPEGAKFCNCCGMPRPEAQEGGAEGGGQTSGLTAKKKKWKDQYTILILVAVCLLAVVVGLVVRFLLPKDKVALQEESSAVQSSVEEEIQQKEEPESGDTKPEAGVEQDFQVNQEPQNSGDSGEQTQQAELPDQQLQAEPDSDFILPDSSMRYLTRLDLEGLTQEELRIARNEIYARHGRMFLDEELQQYFDSFDWYTGTIQPDDFQEELLNDFERKNIELMVAYEEEMGYR